MGAGMGDPYFKGDHGPPCSLGAVKSRDSRRPSDRNLRGAYLSVYVKTEREGEIILEA